MFPFSAHFGYSYKAWRLSLSPYISAGGCLTINYYFSDQLRYRKVRRTGLQCMFKAGFITDISVYKNVYARLGGEYCIMIEKGGDIGFVAFRAGAGMRF
jgi:hypothetical protein